MKKVSIVQFGNKRETIEVADNATYADVKAQIDGADQKYVCVQGESIDEFLDKPVDEDTAVFISPKKIAQGVTRLVSKIHTWATRH